MEKCFFCGEGEGCVLEIHHVIPRKIQEKYHLNDNYTITLCANCHRKMHHILRYIFSRLNIIEMEEIDNDIKCYPNLRKEILKNIGDGIEKTLLIEKLKEKGYTTKILEKAINILRRSGEIYEPIKGYIKKVD